MRAEEKAMDEIQEESKSQKKRDAKALQDLGEDFIHLSLSQLEKLLLPELLLQAILEAKKIKSHGARRRQLRLIGKLLRAEDAVAIKTRYLDLLKIRIKK